MAPELMNSFLSYTSAASGLPPRGGGSVAPDDVAAQLSRKRSTRKGHRRKAADDVMMSSMTSGRSEFDAMNTMVSTPGGGRRLVARAEPSIAVERPDFVENPVVKGKREGGSEGGSEQEESGKGKGSKRLGFKISGFICCMFPGNTKEAHLHGEGATLAAYTVVHSSASTVRSPGESTRRHAWEFLPFVLCLLLSI